MICTFDFWALHAHEYVHTALEDKRYSRHFRYFSSHNFTLPEIIKVVLTGRKPSVFLWRLWLYTNLNHHITFVSINTRSVPLMLIVILHPSISVWQSIKWHPMKIGHYQKLDGLPPNIIVLCRVLQHWLTWEQRSFTSWISVNNAVTQFNNKLHCSILSSLCSLESRYSLCSTS